MSNYVYLNYQRDLFSTIEKHSATSLQNDFDPLNRTILQRVAGNDLTAFRECFDTYKDLVWNLSKKFLETDEEVEQAVIKIFRDIRKYAGAFDQNHRDEVRFITFIACRRLLNLKSDSTVLMAGVF